MRSQVQSGEDAYTAGILEKTRENIDLRTKLGMLERELQAKGVQMSTLQTENEKLEAELKEWGSYARNDRAKKDQEIAQLRYEVQSLGNVLEKANRDKDELEARVAAERENVAKEKSEKEAIRSQGAKDLAEAKKKADGIFADFESYKVFRLIDFQLS